jgi:hypothetical protein
VHTCNPSLRWGGWWIQATWAKKKEEEEEKIGQILPQLEKKLGVVVYTCHPVYPGGEKEDCSPECKNGENLFEKQLK